MAARAGGPGSPLWRSDPLDRSLASLEDLDSNSAHSDITALTLRPKPRILISFSDDQAMGGGNLAQITTGDVEDTWLNKKLIYRRSFQGAKAAQKRERNAKTAGTTAKSQLKVVRRSLTLSFPVSSCVTFEAINNEAAKNIQCKVCFQTFLQTSREPALKEHAENRHSKALLDCFPMWKP
ncbi:hypothetical protein VP01_456g5 [Puccinia sorghi]|uniref:At2g23090-like zinc-binding domain-containing protein n=1 Tax=Puccinia sorghi TaxID=27349 RepID=A0A0L6UNQ6_9BASI|nr:hypothetical protein VP01_456g5 [Puccinia sorghi]